MLQLFLGLLYNSHIEKGIENKNCIEYSQSSHSFTPVYKNLQTKISAFSFLLYQHLKSYIYYLLPFTKTLYNTQHL